MSLLVLEVRVVGAAFSPEVSHAMSSHVISSAHVPPQGRSGLVLDEPVSCPIAVGVCRARSMSM